MSPSSNASDYSLFSHVNKNNVWLINVLFNIMIDKYTLPQNKLTLYKAVNNKIICAAVVTEWRFPFFLEL